MNNIEEQYRKLADQWNQETGYLSNLGKAVQFPSFRAIIELGWPVVPLLLLDLKQQPNHLSNLASPRLLASIRFPMKHAAR